MSKRDVRLDVFQQALSDPHLSYGQRTFLVVVTTIKTEFVDGEHRHGSKSMGPDGKYTLHVDYLARAMASSEEAVRKLQRSLKAQGFLSEVHRGTFGRPSTWHALTDVRGAKNGRLTPGRKGTPYGVADWLVRSAEKAPLAYRTPDGGDHAPEPGGSEPEPITSKAPRRRAVPAPSALPAVCPWHQHETCPPDCRNADRRRTA